MPQDALKQPLVQAKAGLLQPTSPVLELHVDKPPELWGPAGLDSALTAEQSLMAAEIQEQQQQSFMRFMDHESIQ